MVRGHGGEGKKMPSFQFIFVTAAGFYLLIAAIVYAGKFKLQCKGSSVLYLQGWVGWSMVKRDLSEAS